MREILREFAEEARIRPEYFIVTDNRIVLLNEEDNDATAKKISGLDKPPDFEPNIFTVSPAATSSTRRESGKRQSNCKETSAFMRRVIPPNISKIVWKKGVGLVGYAGGYGAHADGYRLKREVASQNK